MESYRYTVKRLKRISDVYEELYYHPDRTSDGIDLDNKIDFDIALNKLGKGKWSGFGVENLIVKDLYSYGNQQKIIINDTLGLVDDEELERRFHLRDMDKLRAGAYERMRDILNGEVKKDV